MRIDVLTLFRRCFQGIGAEPAEAGDRCLGWSTYRYTTSAIGHAAKHVKSTIGPLAAARNVLRPEPVVECVEEVQRQVEPAGHVVLLTPQGRKLDQPAVEALADFERLVLICGRYEGIDQTCDRTSSRRTKFSIGDFILNGGEVAAMVVIDAVVRMVPDVLGDEQSNKQDSFSGNPPLLEFPHYHAAGENIAAWKCPKCS